MDFTNANTPTPDAAQSQPANNTQAQTAPVSNTPPIQNQPTAQPNPQNMVSNAATQPTATINPMVRHASVVRQIAETLAGGPRATVSIDDYGNRVVQQAPLSRREIGMAIALSAIQGSLAGLSAKGPNANAQAASLGFNAVAQSKEKQTDDQNAQAQQDFSNRASAVAANLRTRNMAQEVGSREEAAHQAWIEQHAPTVSLIRQQHPDAIIKDNATEQEISDPAFIKQAMQNGWIALPVQSVPRFDAQGNHYSVNGTPLHDNLYMIVNGNKFSVPDETIKAAQDWNLPGFADSKNQPINVNGLELRLGTITDTANKVAALNQEQNDLNNYYDYLSEKGVKGSDGKRLVAPDLKQVIRENPSLSSAITGEWARHFGETPGAALRAMKDDNTARGTLANLYGGQSLLNKFETLQDADKKHAESLATGEFQKNTADAKAANSRVTPDDFIDTAAKALASGDFTNIKDIASMRGEDRLKIFSEAKKLNPNFNTGDVQIKMKTANEFANGKQADQIQSFNTFLGHAGEAANASADYRRLGSPLINRSLNWLEKNATNDQTYQRFVTALQPVRDEYMTFLQNNHALTESDKKAGDVILSNDSTPAQVEAALKQMGSTAFVRLGALNDRYKRVMGTDFPDLLNDDSRNAANVLGLGAQAAKFQTGGRVTGSASGAGTPGTGGNPAPEGTIVKMPDSTLRIKQNGQWMPHQQ